jgi:hypothetical protein
MRQIAKLLSFDPAQVSSITGILPSPIICFPFFLEIQLLVTVKITENNLKFLPDFFTTQLILSFALVGFSTVFKENRCFETIFFVHFE